MTLAVELDITPPVNSMLLFHNEITGQDHWYVIISFLRVNAR